jgi:3-oxoacyl-[acyl-carrier protein] reductase
MDLGLSGKVAVITGSSRGIGFCIAETLGKEGCRVILNGRNSDSLKNASSQIAYSEFVVGDVCTQVGAKDVINRSFEIYKRIDILVCNVGSGASVPPGQEQEEEWLRVLGLNLLATTNAVAAARPYLAIRGGVVLCISSICGSAAIDGAPITYSASKSALNSFVRGASRYLAKESVRINALAPGNIIFDGSSWSRKLKDSPEKISIMLEHEVPLRRFGTVQEVADMTTFLCSERASFATGALFVLDGGQLRNN